MTEAPSALVEDAVNDPALQQDRLHLRMLEALIFASAAPVAEKDLAARLPEGADIARLLAALQQSYAGNGVNLRRIDGSWAFRTAEDLAFLLRRDVTEQKRLSRAAKLVLVAGGP